MGKPSFDAAEHSYIDFWGKKFTSATSLVGMYKSKFDSEVEARKYVDKWYHIYPMTVEQCLFAWDFLRDYACEQGTAFHEEKERQLLAVDYHEVEGRIIPTGPREAVNTSDDYFNSLPDGKYSELILWNDKYGVSGTSDIVIIETDGNIRYVDVDDWKTNKKLNRRGFGWEKGRPKMMKYPLHHLEECELTTYSLQLSLYTWMLEEMGFTPRYRRLYHNPQKDPNSPSEEIPVDYIRKDVLTMLNDFITPKKDHLYQL